MYDTRDRDFYHRRYADWDQRFERAVRARSGFAWGTFFIGALVGAILF
ncbi:MAG: hypothetical protein AAF850_11910 [Pseudomonadota bacterium]